MSNHISTVRQHLLDTLADLRNKDNPMDIDRARAVADVANVIVNTAKVEVDYLKATNQTHTPFLEVPPDAEFRTITAEDGNLPNGISSITRHRIAG
ncbi:hypothetical protein ACSFBF_07015 [Variovorax sp. ZT5P49]|uniref:hypothetical protein n=1 Tax=Variovorax sp. ZT5P49 TaxID=3443733 RepID=UPI003F46A07E